MPRIIPIKDLKNTTKVSEMCHESDEPIFVTRNGYGDMVFMSMETYESNMKMQQMPEKTKLHYEAKIAELETVLAGYTHKDQPVHAAPKI